ncbi:hypothetical protein BGX31_000869, partial [Mortierella sp. GBA43]
MATMASPSPGPIRCPIALPEIAAIVGALIALPDRARCLRVSRSWHAAFLPLVWSTVAIRRNTPPSHVLARHSHLVRTLSYHADQWSQYGPVHCPNLSLLSIQSNRHLIPDDIALHHQHISHLILQNMSEWISFHCILQPLPYLPNLSKLELDIVTVESDHSADFWNLCTRLDSLLIHSADIILMPAPSLTFHRLKELVLKLRSHISLEQQLDFITQCPKLTYLDWNPWVQYPSHIVDRFADHLASGNLPDLKVFICDDIHAPDKRLSLIIGNMHTVQVLDIPGSELGPLSWATLQPHLQSLQVLNIATSPAPEGSIVSEILSSCPALKKLSIDRVKSQDILDGKPWVCEHSMRELIISIYIPHDLDAHVHQRHILGRISRLINLVELNLTNVGDPVDALHLDFRLHKGLGLLGTLKQLETLSLENTQQCMSDVDVQWMIDHWMNLQLVVGALHP